MIPWSFAAMTVVCATIAGFSSDLKKSSLALWAAGLGAGALYLTLGAELLAIVQWIISTLVTISLLFFSSMYGASREASKGKGKGVEKALRIGLPLVLGTLFALIVWHGGGHVSDGSLVLSGEGTDLPALGRRLMDKHLLSLEVLSLTLFLVLIGGGVIARPERPAQDAENGGPT